MRAAEWLLESRALFRESGGERHFGIEHPVSAFLAQAMQDQGDHAGAYALYEEALAEASARQDRHAAAYALRHLGRLHLGQGQTERAVACVREGLPILLEMKDRRCTPPCLEALAYGILPREQPAEALRLLAAAEVIRESTGMPLGQADRARHEREYAAMEARLGREQFVVVWTEGREMSMERAIEYALGVSLTEPEAVY